MNRAERRARLATATPAQRAAHETLMKMNALIAAGANFTIGPAAKRRGETWVAIVAIGSDPHWLTLSPKSAREMAEMFEGNPQTYVHDLAWIPKTLRESADIAEQRVLAGMPAEGTA